MSKSGYSCTATGPWYLPTKTTLALSQVLISSAAKPSLQVRPLIPQAGSWRAFSDKFFMADKLLCDAGASCHTSSPRRETLSAAVLGARLIRLRWHAGLLLPAVAAEAGLSKLQLQKIEDGLLSPRIDSLHRILTVLAVSFDRLFGM
jgi:hypothetical protein